MQTVNANTITQGFAKANQAYIARCEARGKTPNLNKEGFNPDLKRGMSDLLMMSDIQLSHAQTLGVDFDAMINGIAKAPNVKKALRVVHFVRGLATGDLSEFTGSAKTALFCFAGIVLGASNRAGLRYLATGKGDEMSSEYLVTGKGRTIRALMGGIHKATFDTQCSVAMSDGGIFPILGISEPMKGKNAATPKDLIDAPITASVYEFLNKISDNDFTEWAQSVADTLARKGK